MYQELIKKQRVILKNGVGLSALVLRHYPGKSLKNNMSLFYLKLGISILDETKVVVVCKSLLPSSSRSIEGQTIYFRFLPGDLSQVYIVS